MALSTGSSRVSDPVQDQGSIRAQVQYARPLPVSRRADPNRLLDLAYQVEEHETDTASEGLRVRSLYFTPVTVRRLNPYFQRPRRLRPSDFTEEFWGERLDTSRGAESAWLIRHRSHHSALCGWTTHERAACDWHMGRDDGRGDHPVTDDEEELPDYEEPEEETTREGGTRPLSFFSYQIRS